MRQREQEKTLLNNDDGSRASGFQGNALLAAEGATSVFVVAGKPERGPPSPVPWRGGEKDCG